MKECESHCALCPEKCTLQPDHNGFCNCGNHRELRHPTQACEAECEYCYDTCTATGDHDIHMCERHKKHSA
jgi:hypothetical protein